MSIMMVQADLMCCKSVGTDLSMLDIDDLMTEICLLKKEVKLLETKLRERDELNRKDVSVVSRCDQTFLLDCDIELKTHIKEEQTEEDDVIYSDMMKVKEECLEPNEMEEKPHHLVNGKEFLSCLNSEQNFSLNNSPISTYNESPTCPQFSVCNEEQKTSLKLLDCDMELKTQIKEEQTDEDDIIYSNPMNVKEESSEPNEMEEIPHYLITGEESLSCLNTEQNSSPSNSPISTYNESPTCLQCERGFSCKSNLYKHMKVHSGERPFRCDQCEKTFSRIYHLRRHMKTHTGERPYRCEECKKTFIRIYHLKRHVKIHTGEKSYKCELCERAFSRKDHLNEHVRFHIGEKPHRCELCGMTFFYKYTLKTHICYTEERSYYCFSCGQSFKNSGCLETHMKCCKERKMDPHETVQIRGSLRSSAVVC